VRCCREDDLKAWVGANLPRTTRQVGAWIEQHFDLVYESRSGLIALLHRPLRHMSSKSHANLFLLGSASGD
jgi:hypothetical protein